jgi:transmembrane sensor
LGLIAYERLHSDDQARSVTDNSAWVTTPAGAARQVRLADGSIVLLGGGTTMRINFSDAHRTVAMALGRARFRVAHDARRPFRVEARGGTVTATGTLFDVWIRPGQRVQVTLLEGAVLVKPPRAKAMDRRSISLRAGQRVTFGSPSAQEGKEAEPQPASAAEMAWMTETQDFNYVPLRDVIAEVNRQSSKPIVLAGVELGAIEVFGSFQVKDADKLARKLAASLDLVATVEEDRILLSRRH